jgi:hypothetical protein
VRCRLRHGSLHDEGADSAWSTGQDFLVRRKSSTERIAVDDFDFEEA